ncbi:MAG: hypothetical protein QOF72_818 [Blastocatellia bacterium]|nr:hypothetical protein [Blastocatellia bacterium]
MEGHPRLRPDTNQATIFKGSQHELLGARVALLTVGLLTLIKKQFFERLPHGLN